jgi:hypothetical protein
LGATEGNCVMESRSCKYFLVPECQMVMVRMDE